MHSGACLRNRNLMAYIEAVVLVRSSVTLDFYLTKNDPGYLDELTAAAAEVPGVTMHEPVPYDELLQTLRASDVGVQCCPR